MEQEVEETEERERARQLLDEYSNRAERYKSARNWLIFVCIALAITCGVFFQKWQQEIGYRHAVMAFVEYYRQDAQHWQDSYFELLPMMCTILRFTLLPPFGNTIFEATIPLSVTFIMSQFGNLTKSKIGCKIG